MDRRDAFEKVVGLLHEAALDETRWVAASALIDETCGSKGSGLFVAEGPLEDLEVVCAGLYSRGERRVDLEREYLESYHAIDERIPRFRRLAYGHAVRVADLYTDEELKNSPAYDFTKRIGGADGLNVRLRGPAGCSHLGWAIGDPVGERDWDSDRLEIVHALVPHVQQYFAVRRALATAEALGASIAGILASTGLGVVQLDRLGQIVEANDVASELLRRADGLYDAGGTLRAFRRNDDSRLQRLLEGALAPHGGYGASGSIGLRRRSSLLPLTLHVTPVTERGVGHRSRNAAALVLIADPVREAPVDARVVGDVLGLTPVEAEIAVLLAEGRTVRQIAAGTGRKYNTVRSHLKQMFGKLGVARQLEVAKAVLSLSSLPEPRD